MSTKTIDFERSFKKLIEQIDIEYGWSKDEKLYIPDPKFRAGMQSAYRSIWGLAKTLEAGEFFED